MTLHFFATWYSFPSLSFHFLSHCNCMMLKIEPFFFLYYSVTFWQPFSPIPPLEPSVLNLPLSLPLAIDWRLNQCGGGVEEDRVVRQRITRGQWPYKPAATRAMKFSLSNCSTPAPHSQKFPIKWTPPLFPHSQKFPRNKQLLLLPHSQNFPGKRTTPFLPQTLSKPSIDLRGFAAGKKRPSVS